MCGIFGIVLPDIRKQDVSSLRDAIKRLFILSESRGKEAAGLAVLSNNKAHIYKEATSASDMIASDRYKGFLSNALNCSTNGQKEPISLIGHSRLVTDGQQFIGVNNQPVIKGHLVAIHNGIITNHDMIWKNHSDLKREYDVDTEILLALIQQKLQHGDSLSDSISSSFSEIEGTASVAIVSAEIHGLVLATNNGSLYYTYDKMTQSAVFGSENFILREFLTEGGQLLGMSKDLIIQKLKPGTMVYINTDQQTMSPTVVPFNIKKTIVPVDKRKFHLTIDDYSEKYAEHRHAIKRCKRCILPETMPFIEFDHSGVCNYCRDYQKVSPAGIDALLQQVDPLRSKDGSPDCIVMFSGGRDSSYGLHLIKQELGLNPIAYTYDWGVITDLGRRNQARLCGKLGVEHIIVSADIIRKRRYVRQNVDAWLHRPDLGMIPIFMAGDKQYYYYANQLRKFNNIPMLFVCECPLELTKFKAGFCGVDESHNRIFDISFFKKLKLIRYYAGQYLKNLRYFNRSFIDNLFAFWSSYFIKHDYIFLYRYFNWDENEINKTLTTEYNWELEPNYSSSWRIGDGTAAFYNYIYHTVAGFTENETLRSNQIREGVLSRAKALELVEDENRTRWDAIQWYAQTIGFNLTEALRAINNMPKLYTKE
jgi:asparagine synthetase B (glutamine-hydrolysing)